MDTQKKKRIGRNQVRVTGFILITVITTALFFRYKGEKLLDIMRPQQQVTYYKMSEVKQEDQTALPQTITVYMEQSIIYLTRAH